MSSIGARRAVAVLAAALTAWACGAHGQEGDKDLGRAPVRCVSMAGIKKTHAIDDRTILFNVRGKFYRNYLPATCRDLAYHDRITYAIPGSALEQICAGNLILVVDRQLRADGAPCALGQFYPISKEEAEILARGPGEQRDAVKVEKVDPPPPSAGDAQRAAPAAPERGKNEP